MSDVRQWLDALGLDQYAEAFDANAIETDLLEDLTDDDLRALGVAALGHRKRILRAIAGRAATGPAAVSETEPHEPPRTSAAEALSETAERRHLTVMFCDLVGSTALSARLDPEDYREVLAVYQAAARTAIERFEGYIARYMGDGLLVYFGYPQAHEDDAERAVRAGLDIAAKVDELEPLPGTTLTVRIGIATGLVVVGDIVGEGASEERAVLGDTPNLAARLQANAVPGSVVVADETHRLVQGQFRCTDRGLARYKGFDEPIRSWAVESERSTETRFEARSRNVTPLTGRNSDLSLLLDRWEQAREGEGQVVVLRGEPGIGKSRLAQALREQVAGGASRVLRYQCSPYHAQSAFFPMATAIERELGFSTDDAEGERLAKLESMLGPEGSGSGEVLPLFAALLSVPLRADRPPVDLGVQRERQRLLDALVAQILRLAEHGPLLSIFEDAHWMDPSTLETVTALVEAVPQAPVLVLVTARREFEVPWSAHSHVFTHSLARLGRRHRLAMLDTLTGGKPLPEEVAAAVVAKTDGVPLYLEEMLQSVLDGDILRELPDRYELEGGVSDLGIPASLHDSLVARLDRMGDSKSVAQICAVIGRETSLGLLERVCPLERPALDTALARLTEAQVLSRRQRAGEVVYTFKHALLQDAAYDSLLRTARKRLHARTAHAIERQSPRARNTEPEVLAHHFTEAGDDEQAMACWEQAGLRARARAANKEAASHLDRALQCLTRLPVSTARDNDELRLRMVLGAAVVQAEGFASPNVERVYRSALPLAERLGSLADACLAIRGLQVQRLMSGRVDASRQYGERLLRLVENDPQESYRVGGCHALGQTLFLAGEFTAAKTVLEDGVEHFDANPRQVPNWPGGQPGEQCHIYLALTHWMLGYPDRARAQMRRALEHSEAGANPVSLVNTEAFVAMLSVLVRDSSEARTHANRAIAMADEYHIVVFQRTCRITRNAAALLDGAGRDTVDEIMDEVEALEAIGFAAWRSLWLSFVWDPAFNPSPTEREVASGRAAAAMCSTNGERYYDAEMRRLEGEQARNSDPALAERYFGEALDIARRQGARALELRAANSLASLLQAKGRGTEAHETLSPIFTWFTEGLDTPDLRRARQLLGLAGEL